MLLPIYAYMYLNSYVHIYIYSEVLMYMYVCLRKYLEAFNSNTFASLAITLTASCLLRDPSRRVIVGKETGMET